MFDLSDLSRADTPPRIISVVDPIIPVDAKRYGIVGCVRLKVIVTKEGYFGFG